MKLSIEGYKSIAEKRSIEVLGLTILSGANSSGKSSFMQPLLLIKQTLENEFDAGALLLDGPNVKLTDSSEIISKVTHPASDFFNISIQDGEDLTIASYKFLPKKGIQIDTVYHESESFPSGITLRLGMNSGEIESVLSNDETFIQLKEAFGQDRKVLWKIVRDRCFLEIRMNLNGRTIPFGANVVPARELGIAATRLIHVPGLRGNPERSYKVAISDSVFPGSFEKYVASIIHNWKSNKRNRTKFDTLISQLDHLGLASSIDTHSINDTRLEIRISRYRGCTPSSSNFVNIADVGFGVSQTLPVLVALLAARKNQIVYIEQPELHLHPKAQFSLAKIIADAVVSRGIRVVIETHSSILIRGIQILVAKNEIRGESVSLNWFTQDRETGQTNITESKLDSMGAFGDWPEDFDSVALDVEQMYLDAVEQAIGNEI